MALCGSSISRCWKKNWSVAETPYPRKVIRLPEILSQEEVARLIDGPLAPIACVSQTAYERCSCPDEEHCGLRMLMLDVRNAISNILDRYTLADVVDITMRKLRKDKVSHPFVLDPLLTRAVPNPKPRKRLKKINGQTAA